MEPNIFTLGEQLSPEAKREIEAMTKKQTNTKRRPYFTAAEDKLIVSLYAAGKNPSEIHKLMPKRPPQSIANRACYLRKVGKLKVLLKKSKAGSVIVKRKYTKRLDKAVNDVENRIAPPLPAPAVDGWVKRLLKWFW